MRRVLRIVTIASKTGLYGGPFDTAREQCDALRAEGYDAVLFAASLRGDRPEIRANEVARFPTARPLLPGSRFLTVLSWELTKDLYREVARADVVHISFSREAIPILACIFSIALGKSFVLQTHGMVTRKDIWYARLFDFVVTRRILGRASCTISLTDDEKFDLRRFGIKGTIIVIGNPVRREFRSYAPVSRREQDNRPNSALFVARLHSRKNPQMFCEAAQFAHSKKLRGSYVIVGPDDGMKDVLDRKYGQSGVVDILDAVESKHVPSVISGCSVFVLCSRDEPWGNSLLGALALGKPVVVSRSSALAGEIERLGAGIVVDDDDAPGLAFAVDSILSNSTLYKEFSERAYEAAVHIGSPDTLHKRLVEVLNRAL